MTTAGLILVACLAGIVVFTFVRGKEALSHLNFYTQTTAFIGPEAPLDQGGIVAAMVGTLEQVAISVVAQRAARHRHRRLPQRGARPAGPRWCAPWSRR